MRWHAPRTPKIKLDFSPLFIYNNAIRNSKFIDTMHVCETAFASFPRDKNEKIVFIND